MRLYWLAASVVLAAAACAASPAGRPGPFPAGTTWQLHAIQSMDDAQGTTRIADPQRFTVRFDADGRASMQLDCNRGNATWEAAPRAS